MTKTKRIPSHGWTTWTFAIAIGLFLAAPADAQYKILHNFTGGADGDGGQAMTLGTVGHVYGASIGGGSQDGGLVYEMTRLPNGDWGFSALYNFTGKNDGANPTSPLMRDPAGNIYGTTESGGGPHGGGTAFELSPGKNGWTLKTLFSFCPAMEKDICLDGGGTVSGPFRDGQGDLYGTKPFEYGGVVYKLTELSGTWTETLLRKFCPNGSGQCADGAGPFAPPILASYSNLYGTTDGGGGKCDCGTVYELSPEGDGHWQEAVLHRFNLNGRDGITPSRGALLMDGAGNLYGTTETGACCGGIIFRLSPKAGGGWVYSILYDFQGGPSGNQPYFGVVMDKLGNLYGTTGNGGNSFGCGVIYKLAPAPGDKWKYSVLHTFGNGFDGCVPEGNLAIDQNGNLYGGTVLGGEYGYGIVFELSTVPISDAP